MSYPAARGFGMFVLGLGFWLLVNSFFESSSSSKVWPPVVNCEWIKTECTPPPNAVEVFGYHPHWVHCDLNPRGIRFCTKMGSKWFTEEFNFYTQNWDGKEFFEPPIYYMYIPGTDLLLR